MLPGRSASKTELTSVPLLCLFVSLLIVTSVDASNLTAQKNNDARQAMARAEASRKNWTEAALRKALEDYDKAYSIWTSTSDFANASKAALESGDIRFLFSEYTEALKRY